MSWREGFLKRILWIEEFPTKLDREVPYIKTWQAIGSWGKIATSPAHDYEVFVFLQIAFTKVCQPKKQVVLPLSPFHGFLMII